MHKDGIAKFDEVHIVMDQRNTGNSWSSSLAYAAELLRMQFDGCADGYVTDVPKKPTPKVLTPVVESVQERKRRYRKLRKRK